MLEQHISFMKNYATKLFYVFFPLLLIILSYKVAVLTKDINPAQQNILNFLEEKEDIQINLTSNEMSHLEDVRKVFKIVDAFFYLSILISSLALIRYKKDKLKELFKKSGIITVSIVSFLGLLGIISFNYLFTIFHKIFFPQGNWQFPIESLLIKTFPLEFFQMISLKIFIFGLFFGILFILTGILLMNDHKSKRN